MTIGERIKEIRYEMNMSQVDFADKINVSKQTLYKYENNIITNIPSDKIESIAKLCKVSPAYLMGWNNNEVPFNSCVLPAIMEYYNQLNEAGKAEATKRVKELTFIPHYTEPIEKMELSHLKTGKEVG